MPKFTTEEMQLQLEAVRADVPHGSRWQHYKGGVYIVSGHAISTETDEVVILYRRIAGPGFVKHEGEIQFARPAREWSDIVDAEYAPHRVRRFVRVEKAEVWLPVQEMNRQSVTVISPEPRQVT